MGLSNAKKGSKNKIMSLFEDSMMGRIDGALNTSSTIEMDHE